MFNKEITKRIVVITIIIGLIVLFNVLGFGQYFSLSYVKSSQGKFAALYAEHQFMVIAVYMIIYVLVTSLSLPGAAVMTLAGGALFGLLAGTVVISFASTIGATIACAASRFILRDWLQGRIGERLTRVNEGLEREGPFYLFTLRLIPLFPFWLINLAMGLTKIPLRTFYWVSQVGMLPGTVVYVNAGRELARLESVSGILSPRLILSFAVLGLFPLVAKKSIAWYRSKKNNKTTYGGRHA
jgi:uncharacterized membrane protein YdjX (TVP38/TMEM64 family)